MSDIKQFKLPDVGEGLTEAEIVTWQVKVGDTVKVNDMIVEIETAKSLVELPCPYAGVGDRAARRRGRRPSTSARRSSRSRRVMPSAAPAAERAGRTRGRQSPAEDLVPDTEARRGGRAGPDRWAGARRPHRGPGRLRPAHDRGQAPAAQGRATPAERVAGRRPGRRPARVHAARDAGTRGRRRRGGTGRARPQPRARPTPADRRQVDGAGEAAGAQARQGPRRRPRRR